MEVGDGKKGKHIDPAEEGLQYEFGNCPFCLGCQLPTSKQMSAKYKYFYL